MRDLVKCIVYVEKGKVLIIKEFEMGIQCINFDNNIIE